MSADQGKDSGLYSEGVRVPRDSDNRRLTALELHSVVSVGEPSRQGTEIL